MAGDGYPKRESHFAHKLTRLLLRTCAAQEIGPAACYLVVQIVHTEDAAHYRRAVTFWNDQLMSVLGFSWGQLDRARKKATAGGWLHYEAGTKGTAGRYWSTIPPEYEGLPDGAIDEDFIHTSAEESAEETPDSSAPVENQTGGNGDIPPHQCGGIREESGRNPGGMCGTFKPNPNPSPSPKKETFDPTKVDLPFGSEDFRQSWGDFCDHRGGLVKRGDKKAELTELAVTRLLKKCGRWGEETAIASIDITIENGWKGLFEPKGNAHGKRATHGYRNQSGRPAVQSIEA
jgi:hypothetical protein